MKHVLIYAGLIFFCGASAFSQNKDWSKKNKSAAFPDNLFMQSIGTGESEEEAKNVALLNLAKNIEVKITGKQSYTSTENITGNTGIVTSNVEEQSQTSVSLELQGLRIEDTDYDKKKKRHYALAVLDRQIAGKAMQMDITDRDTRFKNYLEQAQMLHKQKSYSESIEKLMTCVSELRAIDRQLKKLRVVLPDKPFEAGVSKISDETKITAIIDQIAKDTQNGNLDIAAGVLTYKLYSKFAESYGSASVVIGHFNYKNSKMSSEFTAYLKDKIESEMGKITTMKIIGSRDIAAYLSSHGVKFDGTAQGLAAIANADATITGSYWDLDNDMEIKTQIIARHTGQSLGSANIKIPKSFVPESISFKPDNFSQIQNDLALLQDNTENQKLKIVVWTDKGDGGVYRDKDRMIVYLKSNIDCYVKLVYHDAGGNNILIFPNKFSAKNVQIKANTVYTVGGDDDASNFKFEIGPPFGTELIKAFASTKPIPDMDLTSIDEMDNGLFLIKKDTKSILKAFKESVLSESQGSFAEASVSLTSVKSASK